MKAALFAGLLLRSGAASLALCACGSSFSAQASASGGASAGGSSGQPQTQAGSSSTAGGGGATISSAGAGGDGTSGGMSNAGGGGTSTGGTSTGGDDAGGAGGAGASECPCAAPTPTCVAGKCVVRGPNMVKAAGFYIDSTEVTNGQYAVFEAAKNGDTSGQATACAWNTSYDPAFDPSAPMPPEKQPVTNVDYCDAAAYCAWADKRVCGAINGAALTLPQLADPTISQWFEACAGPKGQAYPYGTTYQSGNCNDTSGSGALVDVGTESKCQGYYPGLFDMLGNAREWTSACEGTSGKADACETIGGSYLATTSCGQSGLAGRDLQAPELGFRCCSK
jgi:sulfatase modifying factor 1